MNGVPMGRDDIVIPIASGTKVVIHVTFPPCVSGAGGQGAEEERGAAHNGGGGEKPWRVHVHPCWTLGLDR